MHALLVQLLLCLTHCVTCRWGNYFDGIGLSDELPAVLRCNVPVNNKCVRAAAAHCAAAIQQRRRLHAVPCAQAAYRQHVAAQRLAAVLVVALDACTAMHESPRSQHALVPRSAQLHMRAATRHMPKREAEKLAREIWAFRDEAAGAGGGEAGRASLADATAAFLERRYFAIPRLVTEVGGACSASRIACLVCVACLFAV